MYIYIYIYLAIAWAPPGTFVGPVPLTRPAAAPDLRLRRLCSRGAADRDQLRWPPPGTTGAGRAAGQLPETKREAGMALDALAKKGAAAVLWVLNKVGDPGGFF